MLKIVTRRSDWGNGSGRNRIESITAKMARFAPRQIATVASAVRVKAGRFAELAEGVTEIVHRVLSLFFSFGAESDDGIDARGAAGGEPAGQGGREGEEKADAEINRGIDRLDLEKQTAEQTRATERAGEAEN